jgi:cysteine desulfurase
MTGQRIYLDHNATSPVRPEAARAVARALVRSGNPSSTHAEGRKARALVEESRDPVAALVGAQAKNVIFTSGATEALNLALSPSLKAGTDTRPWRLFISATEHAAVRNGHRFPADAIEIVPVSANGIVDLAALERAMDAHLDNRPLLALQLANNETGVIQPVAEAAQRVHARGGLLVCDVAPAAGRMRVEIAGLGADLLAFSAHKIGGPSGVGALVRATDAIQIDAQVRGGGQERGLRGGTENVPGIAGFAAAAAVARGNVDDEAARLAALRERAETGLRKIDANATIFGADSERLPNTVAFAVPGIAAETALIVLDLDGVALSSGSACASGKVKSSHVLEAMGVGPDIVRGMLRASLGWTTRAEDIDQFLEAVQRLRANSPAVGKVLAA